jgi:hypothetical protein
VRPADPARDAEVLARLSSAFDHGERVIALVRQVVDAFGPDEFGLEAALPDAADQIVTGAAGQLEDRVATAFERLFAENRATFHSLATAGYPLPRDLRAAVEVALDRRLGSALRERRYGEAIDIAHEAIEIGASIDAPRAREAIADALLDAVRSTIAGQDDAADAGIAVLRLAGTVGIRVDLGRAQELLYDAITSQPTPALRQLGRAVGLAVDRLDQP